MNRNLGKIKMKCCISKNVITIKMQIGCFNAIGCGYIKLFFVKDASLKKWKWNVRDMASLANYMLWN